MVDVIMFSKNTPKKGAPVSKTGSDAREVVVLPGVDMRGVSEAWGFFKRTGRTHNKPRPSDSDE